jgi:hypothetical protein
LKGIGIFIIVAILFSYVPVIPLDDCLENHHNGNAKMDCGNIFHCPLISNISIPETLFLPLFGRLVLMSYLPEVDELPDFIFHPPKKVAPNSNLWG